MLLKVIVVATLAVAINCREYQTYSLNTIITHNEPKGDSRHYFEPVSQTVAINEVSGTKPATVSQGPQHAKYNFDDINNYFIRPEPAPKNPAPVHENVIDVTSPAPPRHVYVQQIPLQRIPVQKDERIQRPSSQVQHTVAVHHTPIIQVQVPHIELQPVHIPIQPVEVHHIPIHHEDQHIIQYEETGHLEESQGQNENGDHSEDYYAIPKYSFEYKVDDPHTHDNKYHRETRDGDVVKGVYSLHEPDGSVRTVEYSSDKKTGFNAYVKNTGVTKHVEPHHR